MTTVNHDVLHLFFSYSSFLFLHKLRNKNNKTYERIKKKYKNATIY